MRVERSSDLGADADIITLIQCLYLSLMVILIFKVSVQELGSGGYFNLFMTIVSVIADPFSLFSFPAAPCTRLWRSPCSC